MLKRFTSEMIAEMPPKLPKSSKLAPKLGSQSTLSSAPISAAKSAASASSVESEVPELPEKGKSMAFVDASHELDPAKFVHFPNSPYQLYQPFPLQVISLKPLRL